jgi:hypothetical protein
VTEPLAPQKPPTLAQTETINQSVRRRRKSLEQRVKVRGADGLNAFTKVLTRGRYVDLAHTLLDMAVDEKIGAADRIRAIQTLLNYGIGRPKQLLEVKQTNKVDVKLMETRIRAVLGIDILDNHTPQPVESTFITSGPPEDRQSGVEDTDRHPLALPAPVPDGQEPVHSLGEVAASGSDVDVRSQERPEADHARDAA